VGGGGLGCFVLTFASGILGKRCDVNYGEKGGPGAIYSRKHDGRDRPEKKEKKKGFSEGKDICSNVVGWREKVFFSNMIMNVCVDVRGGRPWL